MTTPPRFELYSFWRTSATYRVRVALDWKGLEATEHDVDLDAGAQRSPEFLAINPLGAIPAMLDHEGGSQPFTQSLAILEYLDEVAPTPPLLPGDPVGRARVRSIAAMLAGDTHPLITPRVKKYLMANAGFDAAAWKAWQTQWFGVGLAAVEQRLATEPSTGAFVHGDVVSMADICLASIVVVTRVFEVALPPIPTIDRIMAACEALPSFAKAEPSRQVGAPNRNG